MYTLVAFATQWGSKHGGINSFNTDFLTAFGVAYHHSVLVVCIVASATDEEINAAKNAHVTLIPLPYPPANKLLSEAEGRSGAKLLREKKYSF